MSSVPADSHSIPPEVRVANSIEDAAAFGPSAVTIGNFDGVHRGHLALLQATVDAARTHGVRPVVMMFSPHPACIVAPDRAPRLLTTPEQRVALMAEAGIEAVLILPFTREIAALSPAEFARHFLAQALGAKVVLVGENFRFGAKAAGDTRRLAELGAELGFETLFLEPVSWRGHVVSASEVRRRLLAGDVGRAARLLGRPHAVCGKVVPGRGIGRKQTVPTLNLETQAEVIPAVGVYVTQASDASLSRDAAPRWQAVTNVGYRPTFGEDAAGLSIETFLLGPVASEDGAHSGEGQRPGDKLENIAFEALRVEFLHHVRDERKFENPAALKQQILRDVAQARTWFRRWNRWASVSAGAPISTTESKLTD